MWSFLDFVKQAERGGGGEHYPQFLLIGWIDFNETFQNSFTHIADVHLLFCFRVFKYFVKFWSFLDFVKQAETGGGHYPQLLLNGWIDFNEAFQNSFTHIADVHLLFCFGVFKFFVKFWSFLDFVKQAETGGGVSIIRNSSWMAE